MKKLFVFALLLVGILHVSDVSEAATNKQLLIINKATNELAFFDRGELVKTFPVGTGRSQELTPEGTFPIVNKIKNRPYYTDGIPGGDPRNPLGDRWLGLDARGTYGTTYAIHGNNNPSSIGNYVSAGCIRMHNDDIHWLFDRVERYTNAVILTSQKSFEEIARDHGYPLLPPIELVIDGEKQAFQQPPVLVNGRVLAPLRGVFEQLGATVYWEQATQTVRATRDDTTVSLTVGSKRATINDRVVELDVPAQTRNNHTLVPVRFISEAFGASIEWNQAERQLKVTSPKAPPEPKVEPIDVVINGNEKSFTQQPFLESGTTMVPLRGIFEELGAVLQWDQATQTITATKGGTVVELTIAKTNAYVNGEVIELRQPAQNVKGHTVVPLRFISEALGAQVVWNQAEKTVYIWE
ncbi:L,D-transpeptidase family protein [Desertibacillus haloalkaliphilus]|uniref:L,D-transpeptidase family protein n=1 Tax=Desertibacillus haloalkaliphilus TaxID=1328930 RepID=UPI0028AD4602|nr:stalk domain-containing protein [Desertibacillus haloalkaliphilus]